MRTAILVTLTLVLAGAGCADSEEGEGSAEPVGETEAPAPATSVDATALQTWEVRFDQEDATDPFQMVEEGEGWRITTGPAGITWRAADLVEGGDFTARASFREVGAASGHREAFGLIVGGLHLSAPDQRYTYFLVRGTGEYLIKQRDGGRTTTLADWTRSDAVRPVQGSGEGPVNALAVRVRGDSVRFVVNEQVVRTLPTSRVSPYGVAGLRVNHRLDLQVSDFAVEAGGPN